MKNIYCACKDPAGMNNILPVAKILRSLGHQVKLFAQGVSVQLLSKMGQDFSPCDRIEDVAGLVTPDAVLVSMCTGTGIPNLFVDFFRKKCPTIAIQGLGGRLSEGWLNPSFWPDIVCVNDLVGVDILTRAWPNYSGRIEITGSPSLDRYVGVDPSVLSVKAREKMNLSPSKPVVFFSGQLQPTGKVLQEVVAVLNEIGREICLIAKKHPRMGSEAPGDMIAWNEAIANFKAGRFIEDPSAVSNDELIAVSDVVISMFSTVLVEAATMRRQSISVLYPGLGMARFREETGGLLDEVPLVSLGCTAKATNYSELLSLLTRALSGDLGLGPAQEKHFKLNGKNAERVAHVVLQS